MDDIRTFVALKYQLITRDLVTWHINETYPPAVRSAWAWRCADDVRHFATENPAAKLCVDTAKRYRDGLTNKEDMESSSNYSSKLVIFGGTEYHAAYAAYYAALSSHNNTDNSNIWAVVHAAHAMTKSINTRFTTHGIWELYISWLVEELCKWESTHG